MEYTNWVLNRLQGRQTRIHFDDFTSDLLYIGNGCDQGDSTSVILYRFYLSSLINLANKIQTEIALAFIDDVTFLMGGRTFAITHAKIHNMMMRPNGAYEWSKKHNSFFKSDKLQLINFSRKRESDPT